jgi:hypothetical protein
MTIEEIAELDTIVQHALTAVTTAYDVYAAKRDVNAPDTSDAYATYEEVLERYHDLQRSRVAKLGEAFPQR